jgi:uncharacterized protein with ParB-like and HNH nuclease domain
MGSENILNRTFEDIFEAQALYEIPFFQRGYAWTRDEWKQLLLDIEEQVLTEAHEVGKYEEHEHFFGAVVVLEKTKAPHPNLKRYLIIDGQQRLTTAYVMLITLEQGLRSKKALSEQAEAYANVINKILRNNVGSGNDSYMEMKIYSAKGDRYPTYLALSDGANPRSPSLIADIELYVAESNNITGLRNFMRNYLKTKDVPYMWSIAQAIMKSLKIVWIPLTDGKDDPQAIFESLNGKGRPLSADELLCNFLFKPFAEIAGFEHEELHNQAWLASEKVVGSENFEDYLRVLFSIGEKKMIGRGRRLYIYYKNNHRHLTATQARTDLEKVKANALYYRYITKPQESAPPDEEIAELLKGIRTTEMSTSYPFILAILQNWLGSKHLNRDVAFGLLRETYVLLIRRKLANLPTTKYDELFPSLMNKIIHERDKVKALQDAAFEADVFVDDQTLIDRLVMKELYNRTELGFARHVLQALDRSFHKKGEYPDYSSISTIEHLLPQTISSEWRAYLGSDADDPNLSRIKNTIGNLGLNSQIANSGYGNKLIEEKRAIYPEPLSALTRRIHESGQKWNLSAIQENSRSLSKQACVVWAWTNK